MINVTIGESKTQEAKPFPKLMDWGDMIVEVYRNPKEQGEFIGIHRTGKYEGKIVFGFDPNLLKDYNGPITIQNA